MQHCARRTRHTARIDTTTFLTRHSGLRHRQAVQRQTARRGCSAYDGNGILASSAAAPVQARQGKGTATDRSASGVTQHPGRARPVAGGHMPGRSLATCVSTDDESRGERAHAVVPLPSRPPASGAVPMPCLRCLPHAVMPVRNPQTTRRA